MAEDSYISIIAAKILLEAKQAMVTLQQFGEGVDKAAAKAAFLKQTVAKLGGDMTRATNSVNNLVSSLRAGDTGFKDVGAAAASAKPKVTGVGGAFEETAKKSKYSIDVIRTGLGVLVAMLVNTVLTGIISFAKSSVKAFTDVEEALWRIRTAEIALSNLGEEISFKGLTEGIGKIKDELKIFSDPELLKGASDFASSLAQFGFSEEQILKLTKGAGALNVASTATEEYGQTVDKLINSLISPQGKSIGELGIAFGETAMQAKGLSEGLLEAGESAKNLTAEENRQVKYLIIMDRVNEVMGTYGEYLDTGQAKLKENSAAWADLKTSAGGFFTAITPQLTFVIEQLTHVIDTFKILTVVNDALYLKIKNPFMSWQEALDQIATEQIPKLFATVPTGGEAWLGDFVSKYLEVEETATAAKEAVDGLNGAFSQEDVDAAGEGFEELAKDLEEVAADAERARQELAILTQQKYDDIQIDLSLKLDDIETEYAQKIEDAAIDLQNEINDIHTDARQAEADAQAAYRQDQLRAEAEYQQKLRELRQRFLMDLEDALHARDARAVLRLIKEYNFAKQQAMEQKALDDKLRKEKLAADLQAIKVEEQRKIEAANLEFQRKMEQLAIEKQREIDEANLAAERKLEDLKLWNEREMEEINRHAIEKQTALIDAYNAEYAAHELYQKAINDIINAYTAANIASMQAMYNYMASLYAGISAMYAGASAMIASTSTMVGAPVTHETGPVGGGFAEGGTVIANRPTLALFGEAGPEMASFTPLGRTGKDVNKVFGGMSGSGMGGGRLLIEMLLSPDLEARVIENSLSKTADIVAKVSRRK